MPGDPQNGWRVELRTGRSSLKCFRPFMKWMDRMDLAPWDPWKEFEQLRAEADRLFAQFFTKVKGDDSRAIAFIPTTDVVETAEDIRIFVSLPGMVEEDIDIAVQSPNLIVRGEREAPYGIDRVSAHKLEWRYGYFERHVSLPEGLDLDNLSATYLTGVLSIVIPKKRN